MRLQPFKLERHFAKYEFSAPYLLSCSDCEPLSLSELLAAADPESRALWEGLRLGYTESQGLPVLRAEIGSLHTAIRAEDVLVTAPEEGIFIAINCLLEKGDHAVVPFPGYQSLSEVARAIGVEVSPWAPTERSGWKFDVDEMKRLVLPSTKLIVVNFPHNPTGATLDRRDFEAIVDFARQREISVFSDEMYRFLEHDPADRLPSACDLGEHAVSLFGMSKSFALAGLRIGWLTTRNKPLMQRMLAFKDYTTICASAPSEVLALMGLRARERLLARNLGIIDANLRLLDSFFSAHGSAMAWSRPRAGTIGFVRLLVEQPVGSFCQELIEEQGVMLLPAKVFDYEGNYFRLGFGRRSLPDALSRLEAFLEAKSSNPLSAVDFHRQTNP